MIIIYISKIIKISIFQEKVIQYDNKRPKGAPVYGICIICYDTGNQSTNMSILRRKDMEDLYDCLNLIQGEMI